MHLTAYFYMAQKDRGRTNAEKCTISKQKNRGNMKYKGKRYILSAKRML